MEGCLEKAIKRKKQNYYRRLVVTKGKTKNMRESIRGLKDLLMNGDSDN